MSESKQIVDELIKLCQKDGEKVVAVYLPPSEQGERLYRGFEVRVGKPAVSISARREPQRD